MAGGKLLFKVKIPKWRKIMAWGIPYCAEVSLLNAPESSAAPLLPNNRPGKKLKAHSRFLRRPESHFSKGSQPSSKPLRVGLKPKAPLLNSSKAISRAQSNDGKRHQPLFASHLRGKACQPNLYGPHRGFLLRDLLLYGKKAQSLLKPRHNIF